MTARPTTFAVAAIALAATELSGDPVTTPTLDMPGLAERALVSSGNTARLQHAMAKARDGQTVTVAVIGGSITQGAKATTPEQRYGDLVAGWWRKTFPKATIKFVNAGIGATGSNYGALRAKRDLLVHRPDVVAIEYGVNDGPGRPFAETLEGLVRQIVSLPNRPAALLLFMMNEHGGNAQEWQSKVGAHYGLAMVSYRDSLWPEIKADRLKWRDLSPDAVHPNDLGHSCAATFVTSLFDSVSRDLPDANALPDVEPVPPPLLGDLFEHTALFEADDLKPVVNNGWTKGGNAPIWRYWTSDQPGSSVEFDVEGTLIYLMFFRLRAGMGRACVTVDGENAQTLDAWFDQTWGGYRQTAEIARELKPGRHRVRIELLDEKHPESAGHEFRIMAIGAAGPERAEQGKWRLTWSDEFVGRGLDDSKWTRCTRGKPDWKNTMSDDPRLLRIEDSVLHLRGIANDKGDDDPAPYLTAGVTSRGKFTFKYGKVRIRARFKSAQGAWPALWMLGAEQGWPACGEIDLMEHLNFDHKVFQTVHSEYTTRIDKTNTPKKSGTAKIARDDWNTYGCEWDAERIVFTVNGRPTHAYPRMRERGPKQWPFDQAFYFILSMQIGGKWVNNSGPTNPAHYPAGMEIDWVRVYELKQPADGAE